MPLSAPARALARLAAGPLLVLALVTPAAAQATRTLTACTPDALAACAELRLTASPGLFEVALRTLGAGGQPLLPVALYNVVLGTGAPSAATPGGGGVVPAAAGGATINDASPWDV